MPVVWNAENNSKLLLMVIQNHFTGTPDYERLAREWGSDVTVASLRVQFCKLRRDGVKKRRVVKNTKIVDSGKQWKALKKEEEIDSDTLPVKME